MNWGLLHAFNDPNVSDGTVEFPSVERAIAAHDSPDYQEALTALGAFWHYLLQPRGDSVMGRFVYWLSHREPESPRMTGFRGLFTENGMSAHVSAFGLMPAPVGDLGSAYRAMILQVANALKAVAEGPGGDIGPGYPPADINAYLGGWPLTVLPAQQSTARVSDRGVRMTVFASVHGMPPDAFEIQFPMMPDEARSLANDLTRSANEADVKKRR